MSYNLERKLEYQVADNGMKSQIDMFAAETS